MLNKSILYNPSRELPHDCPNKTENVNQSMEKFKEYMYEHRFKIPLWCGACEVHYLPTAVCGHILSTGFREGLDGVEYFGDSFERQEERRRRKKAMVEVKKHNAEMAKVNRITQYNETLFITEDNKVNDESKETPKSV